MFKLLDTNCANFFQDGETYTLERFWLNFTIGPQSISEVHFGPQEKN